VIFKPSNSEYNFGRLADPADIARYGLLSQSPNVRHGNTGDTGDYPPEEVAQMAHSLGSHRGRMKALFRWERISNANANSAQQARHRLRN
jgi:hypothetical protein